MRVALLVAATLAATIFGCGKSSPDRSDRAGEQTTFSASGPEGLRRGLSPFRPFSSSADNEHDPTEELAWLTAARDDPDPSLRLAALENWAHDPGETLDPVTHALVDPDESVRKRAQELFEEELERR